MAKIISDRIESIEKGLSSDANKKNKYLVIMNTRHAMGYVLAMDGKFGENTCRFLKDKFGKENVHNVLFHHRKLLDSGEYELINDGKWDAAFYLNDHKSTGFDLAGSPFGNDPFDYLSHFRAKKYSDVFDGFVFVEPLFNYKKQDCCFGFFDKEYLVEVDRRCQIAGIENKVNKLIERFGYNWLVNEWPKIIGTGFGLTEEAYLERIRKWL